MRRSNQKQRKNLALCGVLILLFLLVGGWWLWRTGAPTPEQMYADAVADAVLAEEGELEPLVELTKQDPMTTWDDQGRVLLLSWHRHPDRYVPGSQVVLSNGEVWTFTDQEIQAWYSRHHEGVSNWNLRLEQLIGLPPDSGYTHVSAFWTDPADVVRPAYVTDPADQMQLNFSPDVAPDFQVWFEENSHYSYEESAYPWTRLGYTYDWANQGSEYGLTEFLIEKDAQVEVEFTKTTKDFLTWLDTNAS